MATYVGDFYVTLNVETGKITLTDTSDYAASSHSVDSGWFGFIVSITAPDGTVIHTTDVESDPSDISYGTSLTSTTDIDIPTDSSGNYQTGDYVVVFKARESVAAGGVDEWDKTKTLTFSGYTAPTLSITHTVDVGSSSSDPSFVSSDTTSYSYEGWDYSITRSHEIAYPDDVISATTVATKDQTVSTFYTGDTTTTITSQLTYTVTLNDLYLYDEITGTKTTTVRSLQDYSQIYDILDSVNTLYESVKNTSSKAEGDRRRDLDRLTTLAIMIREAAHSGESTDIHAHYLEMATIYEGLGNSITEPTTPQLVTAPFDTDNNELTVAYATDNSGTGFVLNTPDSNSTFIAFLSHNRSVTPVVGDYSGLWRQYIPSTDYLPLSGGTLTGAILGNVSASVHRPQGSTLNSNINLSALSPNTDYYADTELGGFTITFNDAANSSFPIGSGIRIFHKVPSNNYEFSTSGSQTIYSTSTTVNTALKWTNIQKIANNQWAVDGNLV